MAQVEFSQVRILFDERWNEVVRLAALLRADDVEDVAAESFARLLVRRRQVEPAKQLAYLRRTVLNIVRDQARRKKTALAHLSAVTYQNTLENLTEEDHEICEAVAALPARQREAVVLRFWLDLSERDMAQILTVSTGSVKTHLSRALTTLRPALEGNR